MIRNLFIISVILCLQFVSYSQEEWKRILFDDENYVSRSLLEDYDNGYLVNGFYGDSFPDSSWVYKTDINGNHLWTIPLANPNYEIEVVSMDRNDNGGLFICGTTNKFDIHYDPMVIKLNACGEKEWSWIYHTPQNYDHARKIISDPNGGCISVLMLTDNSPDPNRITIAKHDANGEILWLNYYHTNNSSIKNEYVHSIIIDENNDIILAGECAYEEDIPPYNWYHQPYYMKLNENGDLIWESSPIVNEYQRGGISYDIISNNGKGYYTANKQYYHAYENLKPSMLKLDNNGDLIDIYDLIDEHHTYGYFSSLEWLSDSTFAGNADWTNDEELFATKAIIIDTTGNILNQRDLVETYFFAEMKVTFDNKLVYLTFNQEDDGMFDIYLFKFNQELEYDSIYTQPFEYDYLCDHPIVEQSIDLEGCGFWLADNTTNEGPNQKLMITPNPATDFINIQLPEYVTTTFQGTQFNSTNYNYQYHKDAIIQFANVNGQIVYQASLSTNQNELRVDVNDFSSGLYVVSLIVNGKVYGAGKLVIR